MSSHRPWTLTESYFWKHASEARVVVKQPAPTIVLLRLLRASVPLPNVTHGDANQNDDEHSDSRYRRDHRYGTAPFLCGKGRSVVGSKGCTRCRRCGRYLVRRTRRRRQQWQNRRCGRRWVSTGRLARTRLAQIGEWTREEVAADLVACHRTVRRIDVSERRGHRSAETIPEYVECVTNTRQPTELSWYRATQLVVMQRHPRL